MVQNGELYHHGILGQKWGVRRYQNADGSLTKAGQKKYGTKTNFNKVQAAKKKAEKANSKVEKAKAKANATTQKEIEKYNKKAGIKTKTSNETAKTKTIGEMSNEEIQERINRIKLEQQLNALQPAQVSKGRAFVESTWNDVAKPAIKEAAKTQLTSYLNDALGEALGNDKLNKYDRAKREVDYTNNLKNIAENNKRISDIKNGKSEDKYESAKKEAEYRKNLKSAYTDSRDLRNMKAKEAQKKAEEKAAKKAKEDALASKQSSNNSDSSKTSSNTSSRTTTTDSYEWDVKAHTPKTRLSGKDYEKQLSKNEAEYLDMVKRKNKIK